MISFLILFSQIFPGLIFLDGKTFTSQLDLKAIHDNDAHLLFDSPKVSYFGKSPAKSLSPTRKFRVNIPTSTKNSNERIKKGSSLSLYTQGKIIKGSTIDLNSHLTEKYDTTMAISDKYSSPPESRSHSKVRGNFAC